MIFAPFALLTVFAAYLGWRMGKPMGETEIINHYADAYVRDHGGVLTDCLARPSDISGARIVIACENGSQSVRYTVGPRGGLIDTNVTESDA